MTESNRRLQYEEDQRIRKEYRERIAGYAVKLLAAMAPQATPGTTDAQLSTSAIDLAVEFDRQINAL